MFTLGEMMTSRPEKQANLYELGLNLPIPRGATKAYGYGWIMRMSGFSYQHVVGERMRPEGGAIYAGRGWKAAQRALEDRAMAEEIERQQYLRSPTEKQVENNALDYEDTMRAIEIMEKL